MAPLQSHHHALSILPSSHQKIQTLPLVSVTNARKIFTTNYTESYSKTRYHKNIQDHTAAAAYHNWQETTVPLPLHLATTTQIQNVNQQQTNLGCVNYFMPE